MITEQILTTNFGFEPEKAKQTLELLGGVAEKLYPEDGYKKAKDEDDLAILTAFNIPKLPNENTSTYAKRASKEWAESHAEEKTKDLQGQISELNKKLIDHPGDPLLKKKIQELEDEKSGFPKILDEKTKAYKDEAEKYKNELTTKEKVWTLKSFIPGNFKAELTDKYKNFEVNQAIEKALKDFDVMEAMDDGSIELRNSVNYDKISAKEFFLKELDAIIDKGNFQNGGGANKQQHQNNNSELLLDAALSDGEKLVKIKEFLGTVKKLNPIERETWEPALNILLKANKLEHLMTQKEK